MSDPQTDESATPTTDGPRSPSVNVGFPFSPSKSNISISTSEGLPEQQGCRFTRPRAHARAIRIVVVDDHAVVRRGLRACLEAHRDCEIVGEADNAEEAITRTALYQPDVVVLDVVLPRLGGLFVASQITRKYPHTWVVAYSASADPVHIRGMLAAGAKGYVLKNSDPSTLRSAILAAVGGRRFLDPGLSDTIVEELEFLPASGPRSEDVLTPRERQVLQYIVWGYTSSQTAKELSMEASTVKTYRFRLREKLSLRSRTELVRYGLAIGMMRTAPSLIA